MYRVLAPTTFISKWLAPQPGNVIALLQQPVMFLGVRELMAMKYAQAASARHSLALGISRSFGGKLVVFDVVHRRS